ncbi:MAG: hypothetical protein ACKOTB_09040 [Planctomycetia bacterium]
MRSTHEPPHLRHDSLAARTVFVAPERAGRPNELAGDRLDCPFCAGNEAATPPDTLRGPTDASEPWVARIVPNRFPVVSLPGEPRAGSAAGPVGLPARGVHEVVIESPAHVRGVLDVEPTGWRESWSLVRRRLAQLADDETIVWATVFKNSGKLAGASLEHVHSQLVGLAFVPPTIHAEAAALAADHAPGRDAFGAMVARAQSEGRCVEHHGGLVALVPEAPRQPFETWIVPSSPQAYLHEADSMRIGALAALTRSFVHRLEHVLPNTDFNWWLHQPPFRDGRGRGGSGVSTGWRWHLEILPRINGLAGFELGTGCHITTMTPEESARLLRDAPAGPP